MATLAAAPAFERIPHPAPVPGATRAEAIADPGFGKVFTDHMVTIEWDEGRGWHSARIGPRKPLSLDPASSVLHYAQEIFEGLKAYRLEDGTMALFRPEENARRFNASADRLAMPNLPEEAFIEAIRELVIADRDWFPAVEGGSLYLRPFMIATEAFLGVRPAKQYKFLVIASPSGNYFKSGAPAVSIWVSRDFTRAAPGGTGAAKCGGNYAASLLPQQRANAQGFDQVCFLDAATLTNLEELGGMNVFVVDDDGVVHTPALTGTILEGVTRSSILTLLTEEGMEVRERDIPLTWLLDGVRDGSVREVFACGTAAVITPIGRLAGESFDVTVGDGAAGPVTSRLFGRLTDIQFGRAEDPHGWMRRLV